MTRSSYAPSITTSTTFEHTITTPLPTVSGLHRPWSTPLPTARAGRVRRAVGTAALVAGSLLLGASAGWSAQASAAVPAVSRPADPPCGYVVEGRTLFVQSLSAHGRVRVYSNRTLGKVRDRAPIGPGESMSLRLKRSGHSERDLVAYVGRSGCEPA